MQFKVPQFIDIEDKLFGPFTFRQFVYLVGGAGMMYVIYRVLPLWLGIIPILIVGGLAALLTFYRINNKPFIYYLQAAFTYFISSKLYLWKQRLVKPSDKQNEDINISSKTSSVPMMTDSKLKDLSWSLDVQDKETSG